MDDKSEELKAAITKALVDAAHGTKVSFEDHIEIRATLAKADTNALALLDYLGDIARQVREATELIAPPIKHNGHMCGDCEAAMFVVMEQLAAEHKTEAAALRAEIAYLKIRRGQFLKFRRRS